MQGRIVNVIKDIWETLKKELGGVKVNNISFENQILKVDGEILETNIKIHEKIEKGEINIIDMNEMSDIEVKDGIFQKVMHKVSLLEDKFAISNRQLVLEKNKIQTKRIVTNFINTITEDVPLERFAIKTEDYGFGKEFRKPVLAGRDKILYFPKKIKGLWIDSLEKNRYEEIIKKIKAKMGENEYQNYKIEAIFDKIPIKNLKNLKYYNNKNEIELYFNQLQPQKEEACFIILKNKINNDIEKIFV